MIFLFTPRHERGVRFIGRQHIVFLNNNIYLVIKNQNEKVNTFIQVSFLQFDKISLDIGSELNFCLVIKINVPLFNNYSNQVKYTYFQYSNKNRSMFRNIYIEAYKNAIQQSSTLEMMLIHVNHIYAGLGCIIQDIQFMVGNILTHFKGSKQPKVENKQRISMPQKLQKLDQISFKFPKYQYLPSSSLKYQNMQNFKPKNSPEQVRSNNAYTFQAVSKRNDSFQDMFPEKKKNKSSDNEEGGNTTKQTKNAANFNPTPTRSANQSQQDFMDYLFKKKKN